MNRQQALAQLWRDTHSDFKGVSEGGVKTIMVYRTGTCLVALDDLTDGEIADRVKGFARPPRAFEQCSPEELRVGDIVKGNCALWRVSAFTETWRERTEMVEAECIDPQGVAAFSIGYRKQFVRHPRDGFWDRQRAA